MRRLSLEIQIAVTTAAAAETLATTPPRRIYYALYNARYIQLLLLRFMIIVIIRSVRPSRTAHCAVYRATKSVENNIVYTLSF